VAHIDGGREKSATSTLLSSSSRRRHPLGEFLNPSPWTWQVDEMSRAATTNGGAA
jgi:hypothetical protein